jgi:hypothetical protein
MATIDTFSEASARSAEAGAGATTGTAEGGLLVSLSALDHEGLALTLSNLSTAFPGESLLIATPDAAPDSSSAENSQGNIRMIPYTPGVASRESWVPTAPDYFNAYKLAKDHGAGAVLMLGSESASLDPESLRKLGLAIAGGADLASPDYALGPREGLVNSAILYPVTRSLFGTRPRFPLAIDLGLSMRMAERLATVAQRFTAINQMDALLWPLSEAAAAGFNVVEIPGVSRHIPQPGTSDLNAVLARVAGSLFADVDAKAALWQRIRTTQLASTTVPATPAIPARDHTTDISAMLETFRIAYTNLAEIWSLVLPPNSLLGLKRLAATPAATFRMPDALWARIVFDFILAYRLRTLNRGHLLGALTPLYLAWVASHLAQTGDADSAERHIQSVAAAFEADKPYLVSRWRWPDRFNP